MSPTGKEPRCRKVQPAARRDMLLPMFLAMTLILPSTLLASTPHGEPEAGAQAPLRFGLLPLASPVFLFQRFGPLRDYLGDVTRVPFALESARDYSSHVHRLAAGEYDLVITAPHFVPIALDTGYYEVLAAPRQDLSASFLVARDDTLRDMTQLAGKRIATPPPEALITLLGKEYLLGRLPPGAAVPEFISFASHNAAVHAIERGLADAAIASNNMAQLEISRNHPVRIMAETYHFPGVGVLAHRRLSPALRERIREHLVTMHERQEDPRVREHMTYYPGYKPASAQDYEQFRTILPEARQHLSTEPAHP